MSYLVSARRWRPQTFEDLVGQEHVSRTLTNAILSGRVAHAFLFTGVRGVGKTTAARILAKALNCERGPTSTPCNDCTNCAEITSGSAVDVLEIDGASNTGVDDVREIIENVRYRPAKSRFKIYIIDEVHMLSNSAFNALLKTLEEPPSHVKFIFATTDPHKLPATVQSRCQRYDFRRIPLGLVVEQLKRIVEREGVRVSDRALFMLAREGEGSMRDAQSLLDQVLAGAGEEVSDADIVEVLGIADRQVIYDIGEAIISRDAARALELLADVYRHGYDLRRLARDVLEHFRNLAVARVSDGRLLPDLPDEEEKLLRQQAERIGGEDCDRAFRLLRETDDEVARSPYPKLLLEMALIKLATLPPLVPVDDLLQRLEELEARLGRSPGGGSMQAVGGGGRTEPARASGRGVSGGPTVADPPQVATVRGGGKSLAPAGGADAAGGARVDPQAWGDFLGFVTRERATLAHHLTTCTLIRLDGKDMEIEAPTSFRFNYLARRDHVDEIEELSGRFFERPLHVKVKEKSSGGGAETSRRDAGKEREPSAGELATAALGNPIVKAAVDILGGEVAEVRPRRPRRREES